MPVTDSVTMTMRYVPAWSFARSAFQWGEQARNAHPDPTFYVGDPAMLAILYSAMSLEALIAQILDDHSTRVHVDDLFEPRVNIFVRWLEGSNRLSSGSARSRAAVGSIRNECRDRGGYGLLVRSRNKLVHGRVSTEVFDNAGHAIVDGPIQTLVRDLEGAGLTPTRPAFPNILLCSSSADWALSTVTRMTRLIHEVTETNLEQQWIDVLRP